MKTRLGATCAFCWIAVITVSMPVVVHAVAPQLYRVVAEQSELVVIVGRAGLFKVFGHDHEIRVESFTGTIRWDRDAPERSEFELEVDAASLIIADDELSNADRHEVQTNMETRALAVAKHPTISFASSRVDVEGESSVGRRLKVVGTLTLRGVDGPLEIPLTLTEADGGIVARGSFGLASKDWQVPQISALGGSVKTSTDLKLEFEIVALPQR